MHGIYIAKNISQRYPNCLLDLPFVRLLASAFFVASTVLTSMTASQIYAFTSLSWDCGVI